MSQLIFGSKKANEIKHKKRIDQIDNEIARVQRYIDALQKEKDALIAGKPAPRTKKTLYL